MDAASKFVGNAKGIVRNNTMLFIFVQLAFGVVVVVSAYFIALGVLREDDLTSGKLATIQDPKQKTSVMDGWIHGRMDGFQQPARETVLHREPRQRIVHPHVAVIQQKRRRAVFLLVLAVHERGSCAQQRAQQRYFPEGRHTRIQV